MDPKTKAEKLIEKYQLVEKYNSLKKTTNKEKEKSEHAVIVSEFSEALKLLEAITREFQRVYQTGYTFRFNPTNVQVRYLKRGLRGKKEKLTSDSYHYVNYTYDPEKKLFSCTEEKKNGLAGEGSFAGSITYGLFGESRASQTLEHFDTLNDLIDHYEILLERVRR